MGSSETGRNRRSLWNYFNVEQAFKQRQIVRLLVLSALNVGISTVAFVTFMNYELAGLRGALPPVGSEPSLLRIAIVWAALMGGLGGLFALFTGVMMTHRMAGPIHGFKRELVRIAQGHAPQPVGVRPGDEFRDVAEALNGALEALYARAGGVADSGEMALDLEEVRATHREILASLENATDGDLDAWRSRMRALSEKLAA